MHIMQIKLCSGQHQLILDCFTGYNFNENCLFLIYKIYLKVIKSHLTNEQCFNTVFLNMSSCQLSNKCILKYCSLLTLFCCFIPVYDPESFLRPNLICSWVWSYQNMTEPCESHQNWALIHSYFTNEKSLYHSSVSWMYLWVYQLINENNDVRTLLSKGYRSFAKKWRAKIDLISLLLNKFSWNFAYLYLLPIRTQARNSEFSDY